MMQRFESIDAAIEAFLTERRSGSGTDARAFVAQHTYLGAGLLDALESLELLEAARTERATKEPLPGADFGVYHIVREVGRGGMGVVYEAIESPLGRRVALKCLPPELAWKPAARARFEREAEITSKLDHSGICTVYGAGVTASQPWIAMRFVEGETLAARIAESRQRGERWLKLPGAADTPRARVLAIASCVARVARALAEAHEHGFVHRDVKPSNIMVTSHGEPVLLDFGLASTQDSDVALTRTGDLPGTPGYLAPELIAGGFASPDAQCDVYSLGVTLYECLALEPPFSAPTRVALYHAILAGTPSGIARDASTSSRDLEVVVATALERDRARRYSGAAEFAADLERVVAGHPITARPISGIGRITRWARREPRQAALTSGLTLAALSLALVGGAYWASRDEVQAAESMVLARRTEQQLVTGFHALAQDRHGQAQSIFDAVLKGDADNVEALAGRVLVSIDRHDYAGAREQLAGVPATRVFDDLRALAAGRGVSIESPDWLEHADAFQLFVSGTRLRRAIMNAPRSERPALAKRAYQHLTEAVLRSAETRGLYHAERALAASETDDPEACRSSAASILALWPDDPFELFAAGLALRDADKEHSLRILERVTTLAPTYELAWQNLGVMRMNVGDIEGALEASHRAISLEPRSYQAHNMAGLIYQELECADEARAAFRRVADLRPDSFESWANFGHFEFQQGKFERAIELLALAIDLDPRQSRAHMWRGYALGKCERWEEAREHFEVAVALAPKNPAMWQGLLSATTALQDLDDTLYVVERALELQPGNKSLLAVKADVERVLRRR